MNLNQHNQNLENERKIRSLKASVRLAEEHNEELLRKIKVMKQNHDIVINRY